MTLPGEQAIVDLLPDGVVITDGRGLVWIINDIAARMLDLTREQAVGRPLAHVLKLRDNAGHTWCEVNRPAEGLRSRTGVPEQSWVLPDGREVLVSARLRRDPESRRVIGAAITIRSGRTRARVDRDRSDLVAVLAHELRSPLSGVKGFVQALLNRWSRLNDEQRLLMLATVNADADRLARLISELLDVARIDTGRLSLYPRGVDAVTLVGRVVESIRVQTARPIAFDPGAALPEIHADPDKFTQVVTNLVENGVRHGAGTVSVSLSAPADSDSVVITVDDEGRGIAPDLRRRVFTKFWHGGATGGSGIGMYIVHGLVRAHGGSIAIGDAPGGGARVTVTWPREQ